ncbi:MAG: TetR family transcriptional regulator [Bradyrhizobium sp.]|nr:TetR family transcriptional regulator [Bradyrhizobium sp.]
MRDGPKKRGRPVGDHDANRRDFVEAARYIIAHHGYTAASIRRVAEHLGRTTGAVTYYFDSKDEIIKAVIADLFKDYEEIFERNPEDVAIETIFDHFTVWEKPSKREAWLVWFQLLPHAATDPTLGMAFRGWTARFQAMLTEWIEQCQQHGTVRSDFPANLLADQITAMTDGWAMMTPVAPDRYEPDHINKLVELAIAMLSPPGKAIVRSPN